MVAHLSNVYGAPTGCQAKLTFVSPSLADGQCLYRVELLSVVDMIELVRTMLELAGEHVVLVLLCVLLFSAVDAALGIGVLLPGETGIVLAAVALSDRAEFVGLAVTAAAAGAFIGDQIGFIVGRTLGSRLDDSALINRVGYEQWERAQQHVAGRFWVIIFARLLPGIRTFVAAAAGAARMPYARFALVCAIAAMLWATLWVVGGAMIGNALLDIVERYTMPSLFIVAAVVAVVVIRRVTMWRRT